MRALCGCVVKKSTFFVITFNLNVLVQIKCAGNKISVTSGEMTMREGVRRGMITDRRGWTMERS